MTLLQKLFQKKSEAKANTVGIQFSKYDCFQLFFTESLADNLKKIDGIMSLDSIRERDSIQAADVKFLDFILMGICRNFRSIARTPFRPNKQFGCTCRKREEELTLPVPYDLFGMYFRKVRGLAISQDSLRPRMSACWSEYSKLYQLLSNILIESYKKDTSYEDLQKTFQDLAYESNSKAGTDKGKVDNRSSAKHNTPYDFIITKRDTFLYAFPSKEYKLSSVLKTGTDMRVMNQKIPVGTMFTGMIHEKECKVCTDEEYYEIYHPKSPHIKFVKAKDVVFYPKVNDCTFMKI